MRSKTPTEYNSPAWRIAGAAVPGTSHIRQGLPCQDSVGYLVTAGDVILAALADGAGAAERAEEGAGAAVRAALMALKEALEQRQPQDGPGWRDLVWDVFARARLALQQLAADQALPLKAFATTLVCAAIVDGWLVAGQIGDGTVVAGTEAGHFFAALRPQRGEYANETYFLTLPDALDHLEVSIATQPVAALALLSDGLLRLALQLPANAPHSPFFAPLLSYVAGAEDESQASERLAAFLTSERVSARTDDDKSLVLAVRPGLSFMASPGSLDFETGMDGR